jgi:hypothetical protein
MLLEIDHPIDHLRPSQGAFLGVKANSPASLNH